MFYKVFFVEDEIITREGIRDNVDWRSSGFEFCGEAADGEMALPLLRTARPDVLITDIKMPFMDGLQLSKIVRERMPWVKIIILSGHDEFEYAQEAIKLGVTDYLLKPVTVQKLQNILQKLTLQLDQERKERENLKKLQEEVEENRAMLCERLLFKLVVGAISSTEAIEKGQVLGLDLVARHYLVIFLKLELGDRSEQYDHDEYLQTQRIITELAEKNPDIFILKRDWSDLILIMKGSTPEYLEEERDLLINTIRQQVAKTRYQLALGVGTSKKRIADISQSFAEALINIQNPAGRNRSGLSRAVEQAELLKVDKSAVENYLRSGVKDGFDDFFNAYLKPLGETALKSDMVKNYIFVDVALATARLVNDLGGDVEKVIPELNSIETTMANIKTIEELQEQTYKILSSA
ncbi:MAG: response regulator [Anaerolineales bacterium]|nr:response regulator [Anaerolineales bacterium]